jgi:ligand-binding sensor domain-containing protein
MQQPLLAYYSGSVLCIDDEANVWQSRDQGISWRKNSTYKLPATFSGTPLSLAADSKGRLWLLTSEGQLWQGALK